jgi:hypothetical protein
MNWGWAIPEIRSIQRTNILLVAIASTALMVVRSVDASIGCLLGGAVVIANLWLMAAMGRLILAAAGSGISGNAALLGAAAIPLKLLIVVGLVYLAFAHAGIDGLGFGAGVLTQMAAIIIETCRASMRAGS